jgi:hypothetical protein
MVASSRVAGQNGGGFTTWRIAIETISANAITPTLTAAVLAGDVRGEEGLPSREGVPPPVSPTSSGTLLVAVSSPPGGGGATGSGQPIPFTFSVP